MENSPSLEYFHMIESSLLPKSCSGIALTLFLIESSRSKDRISSWKLLFHMLLSLIISTFRSLYVYNKNKAKNPFSSFYFHAIPTLVSIFYFHLF